MGAKLSKYDDNLRKRIETIRKEKGIKQADMAEKMGVSLERYKRFIYGQAKIPAESIATVVRTLPIDPEYILFGREETDVPKLAEYLMRSSDATKAELFLELANRYRLRDEGLQIDFTSIDGLVIEKKGHKKL